MCGTRLAANTGRKNYAKNRHLLTIVQLCRAISSQLGHASTSGKKLVNQQYLPHMSLQYGELRPTSSISLSSEVSKIRPLATMTMIGDDEEMGVDASDDVYFVKR